MIGLLGLLLRLGDFPVAPAVVGLILGPIAETQLRRALTLSEGDPSILVSSPTSIVLWLIVLAALVVPGLLHLGRRRRAALAATRVKETTGS